MWGKKENWTIDTKMMFDRWKFCPSVGRGDVHNHLGLFYDNVQERNLETSTEENDKEREMLIMHVVLCVYTSYLQLCFNQKTTIELQHNRINML